MTDEKKERTYSDEEIEARLKQICRIGIWKAAGIRRKFRTHSWKGTLMVINAVGHLAEAAWHHPDITASYAWVEVRLKNHNARGITDKDFELAQKDRGGGLLAAGRCRRRARGHAREESRASPMSATTTDLTRRRGVLVRSARENERGCFT